MTVHYTCPSAACGRQMNSPDSDIGREVRCPECGAVRLVPMGDTHGLDLAGGADRDRLLEGEPVEIPQVRSASSIACPQCGRAFAITEQLCSQCGWVNATTVERLSIPDELMPQEDSPLPPPREHLVDTASLGDRDRPELPLGMAAPGRPLTGRRVEAGPCISPQI